MQFQSLIGRLQSLGGRLLRHRRGQFQSLIGRLQSYTEVEQVSDELVVSIPHR